MSKRKYLTTSRNLAAGCADTGGAKASHSELLNAPGACRHGLYLLTPSMRENQEVAPAALENELEPIERLLSAASIALDSSGCYGLSERYANFPLRISLLANRTYHCSNCLGILTQLGGRGTIVLDNRTFLLSSGDTVLVNNLEEHGLQYQGDSRIAAVLFDPELVYTVASRPCDYAFLAAFYLSDFGADRILHPSDLGSEDFYEALSKLLESYFSDRKDPIRQAGCKLYLLEMLHAIATHFDASPVFRNAPVLLSRRGEKFAGLLGFLRRNYAERITISDAAKRAVMSESSFMRSFKRATGLTFIEYLNRLRVQNAYQLVEQTHLSMGEIAQAVGFSSQSYFDKRFKDEFGSTPSELRKRSESAWSGAVAAGE